MGDLMKLRGEQNQEALIQKLMDIINKSLEGRFAAIEKQLVDIERKMRLCEEAKKVTEEAKAKK